MARRLLTALALFGSSLGFVACVKHHDTTEATARAQAADTERELELVIIEAQRAIDSDVAALDDMRVHKLDESPGLLGSIRNRKFATHPQARPMIRLIVHRVIENADAQIIASQRLRHFEVLARAERTRERARETLDHMASEDLKEAEDAKRAEAVRHADAARPSNPG